jgi:hypothetical protein
VEFFNKHQTVIFRSVGAFMLLVGFVVHFWITPKEVLSENEIAAANVARMEAKVAGGSSSTKKSAKKDSSKYLQKLKSSQEKQMQYLTIVAMIFGIGFLGYSFKPKSDS